MFLRLLRYLIDKGVHKRGVKRRYIALFFTQNYITSFSLNKFSLVKITYISMNFSKRAIIYSPFLLESGEIPLSFKIS